MHTLCQSITIYPNTLFFRSGTPLGPPTTKMNIFACEVTGIKMELKGGLECISEEMFGKYSKIKMMVLTFFKKVKL